MTASTVSQASHPKRLPHLHPPGRLVKRTSWNQLTSPFVKYKEWHSQLAKREHVLVGSSGVAFGLDQYVLRNEAQFFGFKEAKNSASYTEGVVSYAVLRELLFDRVLRIARHWSRLAKATASRPYPPTLTSNAAQPLVSIRAWLIPTVQLVTTEELHPQVSPMIRAGQLILNSLIVEFDTGNGSAGRRHRQRKPYADCDLDEIAEPSENCQFHISNDSDLCRPHKSSLE